MFLRDSLAKSKSIKYASGIELWIEESFPVRQMQSHLERWTINFQEILLQNLHESTFEGGRDHREEENFKFLRLVMVIKTRKVQSINHVNRILGFLTLTHFMDTFTK